MKLTLDETIRSHRKALGLTQEQLAERRGAQLRARQLKTKDGVNVMKPVRIRVIARHFYEELAQRYLTEGKEVGPCPLLEVGQEFIYEGSAVMPEGFCPWAWIDVYRTVSALSSGATHKPWNNRDGQSILCCTDGIRPVVFEITALD